MHDLSATVVAIATPAGRGGLGCIRISGGRAFEIAQQLFAPAKRLPSAGGAPRFGRFLDREAAPLDHGYLLYFAPGRSFTGEATAELWTHGSPAVLQELIDASIAAGAVAAGPGEFTYRALRNGRIDLARGEAIHDLIEARTRYQARVAFEQTEGSLSRRIAPLREQLEEWIARGEAAVEFVEESETHLGSGDLARAIAAAREECDQLQASYQRGRVVRDGARLVLVGRPNVGKSSLFNRLLESDRAIVTEIAGTTRDTLEEDLNLNGVPVRLVDTAGLREVQDLVEREGVGRAKRALEEADLVLLVLDGSRRPDDLELETLRRAKDEVGRWVAVTNKSDLSAAQPVEQTLAVSAHRGDGIDQLREQLAAQLSAGEMRETPTITNSRHAAAIERAQSSLACAAVALEQGLSEELVLEDLQQARRELGEITGEFGIDDLYDRVFTTFCIGK